MAGMQEAVKGEAQGIPETSGYDSMEREYLEVLPWLLRKSCWLVNRDLSSSVSIIKQKHYLQSTLGLQVIRELTGDQTLDRFRVEYEKLFKAVKKSHGAFSAVAAPVNGVPCNAVGACIHLPQGTCIHES